MKVLEESLSLLKQLGICSDRLNVSTNEFLQSINGIIYFACFVGPLMISSAIFIYKNLSDLETSTNAMLVLTAGSASFGGFLTLDRVEKTPSFKFYAEAERKGCMYVKRFRWFCPLALANFGLALGEGVYKMYQGDWDVENYYLPCNLYIPFVDDSTVVGYLVQFVFQFWDVYTYCMFITGVIMYFVNSCMFIIAGCQEYEQIFDEIGEKVRSTIDAATSLEIKIRLRDAIQLHMKIKELFDILSDNISGAIFFQLLCNVVYLAAALFQTEQTITNIIIEFIYNIACLFAGTSWTFLLCYHATMTSLAMSHMGDSVYNAKWYLYPNDLKKYGIMIIARAQTPIYFTGFKLVRCTLDVFTTLNRTTLSYYIMFRNIQMR